MQNSQQEFLVTARKWRPLSFNSVVGQSHITTILQNAVKIGRIHQAYLFSGPRGVGKTTTARIFARAINCTNPQADNEPCNECESCRSIIEGRSIDVIEIDGASNNSVDDVRNIVDNSRYAPTSGKYKIYIIDEVHMLTNHAFNALLKTLEEPPPHLLFIFATTEQHKILPTILSRCQRFEFKRMEIDSIVRQLGDISAKENIQIDEKSLITIAKKGDGSMRDSQSIFDQVRAFCGDVITFDKISDALHLIDEDFFFRISDDIKDKNLSDIFVLTKELLNKGYDLKEAMEGFVEHIRNILTIKVSDAEGLVETSKVGMAKYKESAGKFAQQDLLRMLVLASNAENQLKFASQPRIKFETALLQMAAMDSVKEISELIGEVRALKKNFNPNVGTLNKASTSPSSGASAPKVSNLNPAVAEPTPVSAPAPAKKPITKEPILKEPAPQIQAQPSSIINANNSISSDKNNRSLKQNWQNFLSKYANSQNELNTLKMITSNDDGSVDVQDTYITFNLSGFVADALTKEKRKIEECLREYFGRNIDVNIVRAASQGGVNRENAPLNAGSAVTRVQAPATIAETELEKKIVNMFKAQLIS